METRFKFAKTSVLVVILLLSVTVLFSKTYAEKADTRSVSDPKNSAEPYFNWYFTFDTIVDSDPRNFSVDEYHTITRGTYVGFQVKQHVNVWEGYGEAQQLMGTSETLIKECSIVSLGNNGGLEYITSNPSPMFLSDLQQSIMQPEQNWLTKFNYAYIECQSIDLRPVIMTLSGEEADPCNGATSCQIPTGGIFVETVADTTRTGTIFHYAGLDFSLGRDTWQTAEMNLSLNTDLSNPYSTSSIIERPTTYGDNFHFIEVREEEDDTLFNHYHDGSLVREDQILPSDGPFTFPSGATFFYFGITPGDNGSFYKNGAIDDGIFDPYSACDCIG